ncbi:MAG: helix-turn-helix domain-containing protein [Mesorhizobium sp.]|uniref:DNA-binding protein n=1 Tax=Mesorhizobium sp. TaxID=1871066 RepID=UPI000FE79988|nr:DNA-binding protein [Mesorhizobium sp.]RWA60679.1 MAG: DNA-binding protein [Mesorhizobium sp.]RWB96740.1 MAG: DNA-binding protein [Mesorhizobium sp.]TIQ36346.1 MAG: helix-turn-helix domain-containing protein [Mesorhizobium sp.]
MLLPDKLSYTIPEFIKATGIARTQIFEHLKHRRLKARKSGRRVLILASDAKAFLASLPDREVS